MPLISPIIQLWCDIDIDKEHQIIQIYFLPSQQYYVNHVFRQSQA